MAAPLLTRPATATDIPQLIALRWDSSVEDGTIREERAPFETRMRAFLEAALADPRWTVWVADDAGAIVSTIYTQQVAKVPRPWQSHAWVYVSGVFTRRERRNEGIGSRLLTTVREWAAARGLEFLLLWPSERSVPFYERAGFHPAETLELEL